MKVHVFSKHLKIIKSHRFIFINIYYLTFWVALHILLHCFSSCTLVSVPKPPLSSMFNSDYVLCFHFSCYECCNLYWIHTSCWIIVSQNCFICSNSAEATHFLYHSLIFFGNGKTQSSPIQWFWMRSFGFVACHFFLAKDWRVRMCFEKSLISVSFYWNAISWLGSLMLFKSWKIMEYLPIIYFLTCMCYIQLDRCKGLLVIREYYLFS